MESYLPSTPIVLFNGYLNAANIYGIIADEESGVRNCVKLLAEKGRKHLGFIVDLDTPSNLLKQNGFQTGMFTVSALQSNKHLIGKNTYLMTLQNGAGHESKLLQFTDKDHVIIGSTQHNSSIIDNGYVNHGGGGKTSIGLLTGNSQRVAMLPKPSPTAVSAV